MKIKDILFPLIVIPFGLAFAGICLLLFFNRGKSRHLVAAKIRTGALILSFSYFTTSCIIPRTCYDPAPPNDFIDMFVGDSIHAGDTMKGYIYDPTFPYYSARIMDSTCTINIQQAFLCPVSGSFADEQCDFYMVLDSNLQDGQYLLKIYSENSQTITATNLLWESYPFRIIQ
jgi:hypothetical protein